ncbi:MAG: PAS domain S-box protein, partial [Planctomycetes bacterium]|nr:PAS domain S-box protein [Planctomycetota bacterium]
SAGGNDRELRRDQAEATGRLAPEIAAALESVLAAHSDNSPHEIRWAGGPGAVECAMTVVPLAMDVGRGAVLCQQESTFGGQPRELARTIVDESSAMEHRIPVRSADHRSEEYVRALELLLQQIPFSLAMLDRDLRYVLVNQAWLVNFRLEGRDRIGQHHYDVFPEIPERWKEVHRRALAGEICRQARDRFVRADGTVKWTRWEVRPWYTAENTVGGIVIRSEDLTQVVEAEEALAASLRNEADRTSELVVLLDAVPTPVFIAHDPNCRHMTGNPAADQLLRNPPRGEASLGAPAEFRPRHFRAFQQGRELESNELAVQRAARGERVVNMEFDLVFDDGTSRTVLANGAPLLDSLGKPRGAILALLDITERERGLAELRTTQNRLRLALKAAAMGTFDFDPATQQAWSDEQSRLMWGFPVDSQPTFEDAIARVHDADREAALKALWDAIRADSSQSYQSEFRIVRPDGVVRWISAQGQVVESGLVPGGGPSARMIGIMQDITARKNSEILLRTSEERFRLIFENLKDYAIFMLDPTGNVASWNAGAREVKGYSEQEILGRHFSVFYPPEDQAAEKPKQQLSEATQKGRIEVFGWRVRQDGTRFQADVIITPIYDAGHQLRGFVKVVRDITESKRAEESLRASKERLSSILNTAVDAIVTINEQGVIESANPATEALFGYTAAEMIGQNVKMLMPAPYQDEHAGYLRRFLETGQKRIIGTAGREVAGLSKAGRLIPIDLSVSQVDHLGLFLGIMRDITRRKELEREIVEIAALEQRNIGQNLHDTVGQELTGLNLMVEALRSDPAAAETLVGRIASALRQCQKDLRIVLRGLLPVAVDQEGLMESLTDLAERTELDTGLPCTFDCPKRIALTDNLTATHLYLIAKEAVHNAVKHARSKRILIDLQVSDCLNLRIKDDGCGISPAQAEHGGVGQRIMRNRASIIGAKLTIEPQRPAGTVVTCTLPKEKYVLSASTR